MGKRPPRKIFEILFWLETSKNNHSRRMGEKEGQRWVGVGEVGSALICPFISQK